MGIARDFAASHRVYVVLKGHRTLIATPDGKIFVNPTGTPGMATGGTGDVLAGMLAAWLAQLLDAEAACRLAVYLHGAAGELADADEGEVSMTAGDLATHIGDAILELTARRRVAKPEAVTARSIVTRSEDDTIREAAAMAAGLTAGAIVLLSGELGAGKTAFVRGPRRRARDRPREVTSPTFTLVHEYRGGRLPLIHVDLYRLERAELDDIGLDADLAGAGVVAIEWAERLVRDRPAAWSIRIADRGWNYRA